MARLGPTELDHLIIAILLFGVGRSARSPVSWARIQTSLSLSNNDEETSRKTEKTEKIEEEQNIPLSPRFMAFGMLLNSGKGRHLRCYQFFHHSA
jgi:hypothetical protein